MPVILEYSGISCILEALIDSGAAGNFIDQDSIQQHHIPVRPLITPRRVQAIDGAPIGKGLITHCMEPINLRTSALHQERIIFHVIVSARHPVVLGLPWLEHHNRQIS